MPRTYTKPPIAEAVCEFRFDSTQAWDWTIPGLLYEKIQREYPVKEQVAFVEMGLNPIENSVVQQTQPRMRFLREDRASLIHVGPNVISMHQLRPYTNWDNYKAIILEHLDVYKNVAHPESITRIGLRYVNHVEFQAGQVELNDYFRVLPHIPEPVPQVFGALLFQVEIPYEEPSSILRFVLGSMVNQTYDHPAYVFDLEMFTVGVPSLEETSNWLEITHSRIEEAFDVAFTERAHQELFGEVKS